MAMKVNDPNLSSLSSTGTSGTQGTARTGQYPHAGITQNSGNTSNDDVHLSELVRSLRSLAADSPERQNKIEALARSYANGTYRVDSQATASKVIDDAFEN